MWQGNSLAVANRICIVEVSRTNCNLRQHSVNWSRNNRIPQVATVTRVKLKVPGRIRLVLYQV